MSGQDRERKSIVFIHPDLGIGGAERLVIDTAVGLQELGHKVTIFTNHCDASHCFDEAKDGTLDVRVRGNTVLPPSILNRFHILLAILRQIHLIFTIVFFTPELKGLKPDVFIIDQLSACVPWLRWLWPKKKRILFYCHYPDQLLARRDEGGILGILKWIYRIPFDWFEGWTMSASDCVVVNSEFTESVVATLFPGLEDLSVIYPCVSPKETTSDQQNKDTPLWKGQKVLLSINRFERKKGIELAIRAFHGLSSIERDQCILVIAGGYDQRVQENVEYHKELVFEAESLGLVTATAKTVPTALAIPLNVRVLFLLSVPGVFKSVLLRNATLLVYTPSHEHFGIVPVEAMQSGVPVLAANTGGPLETVLEGRTGWLRDINKIHEWTEIMRKVLVEISPEDLAEMGRNGRRRVQEEFTRASMAERFDQQITQMLHTERKDFIDYQDILLTIGVSGFVLTAIITLLLNGLLRSRLIKPDSTKTLEKLRKEL